MALADFDALLATTLKNYNKSLTDNIFKARLLTNKLMAKDKVKMKNGGTHIVEPLIYGLNSTAGSYAGFDTISLAPQTGISAAQYSWKQFAASVAMSGIDDAKNNGEQAIIDLLEAKVMQAEESIKENFNVMLFADGSGNSSKDWEGLGNIVEATGTVGGIEDSNTWWRSYEENTSAALTIAYMSTAYNTVSVGNEHPDLLITTQTLYEKYEALLQPSLRYTDATTASAGFQNLIYKAAPVGFDTDCTSGVFYFLNTKYLKLVGHTDKWFKISEWVTPEDVDARYAIIKAYGNLTCSNRKKQGKLTAKTA